MALRAQTPSLRARQASLTDVRTANGVSDSRLRACTQTRWAQAFAMQAPRAASRRSVLPKGEGICRLNGLRKALLMMRST